MLLSQLTFLVAAVASVSSAAPTAAAPHWKRVVHEERTSTPNNYKKAARIESTAILPLRIGLTQTNLDNGPLHLEDVSSPNSENYGKYWTAEQVHDMFAPLEETVNTVMDWLHLSGIDRSRLVHSDNKGWIAVDVTTEEAERFLDTEFYEHEHAYSSSIRAGCDKYHVPEHVKPHIDYITPGIKLSPVVKREITVKRSTPIAPKRTNRLVEPLSGLWDLLPPAANNLPADIQGCGTNITPACIKALYKIPNAHRNSPGNSLGLYEQGDYFSETDINAFFAQYAPYVPQNTFPINQVIDGAEYSVASSSPLNGGEADIDIDMATSLIYPQKVTLYQTDDQIYSAEDLDTTNLFNTFLDALDGSYCSYSAYGETGNDPSIDPKYPDPAPGGYKGNLECGIYKPTQVISASYGQAESDLPPNYSKRQCNEFLKLGLQGHSILVSSGDYGVASSPGDGSPSGCLGPEGTIFNPQYPSNCPWLTSVGATMLYADQTVNGPESVLHADLGGTAVNFSSSGGFSNYYPQPFYQFLAVQEYFAFHDPGYPYYEQFNVDVNTTSGLYNRIGRGYPDISANGANFRAYTDGHDYFWYGTSLAAPLFASVFTLINEERYAIGKGPVGFVNPALYINPFVLNDITNGTNVGCGSEGFSAVPGWDPATGLGTPNYPALLDYFLLLP